MSCPLYYACTHSHKERKKKGQPWTKLLKVRHMLTSTFFYLGPLNSGLKSTSLDVCRLMPLHKACVRIKNERKSNVMQSNVNLNMLVLACSRVPLVHVGVHYLVVGGLLFVKVIFCQYLFITLEGGWEYGLLFVVMFPLIKYEVCDIFGGNISFFFIDVGICRFSRSYVLVCMSPLNVMLVTTRVWLSNLVFVLCLLKGCIFRRSFVWLHQ